MNNANRIRDDLPEFIYREEIKIVQKLLKLPERRWYAELLQVLSDKHQSRSKGNYSLSRFDRRKIELEEHFKYFVYACVFKVFGAGRLSYASKINNSRAYSSKIFLPKQAGKRGSQQSGLSQTKERWYSIRGFGGGNGDQYTRKSYHKSQNRRMKEKDSSTKHSRQALVERKQRAKTYQWGSPYINEAPSSSHLSHLNSKMVSKGSPQKVSRISSRRSTAKIGSPVVNPVINMKSMSTRSVPVSTNALQSRTSVFKAHPPNPIFFRDDEPSSDLRSSTGTDLGKKFGQFLVDLPEIGSEEWNRGFVFKGVFFVRIGLERLEGFERWTQALNTVSLEILSSDVGALEKDSCSYHLCTLLGSLVKLGSMNVWATPILFNRDSGKHSKTDLEEVGAMVQQKFEEKSKNKKNSSSFIRKLWFVSGSDNVISKVSERQDSRILIPVKALLGSETQKHLGLRISSFLQKGGQNKIDYNQRTSWDLDIEELGSDLGVQPSELDYYLRKSNFKNLLELGSGKQINFFVEKTGLELRNKDHLAVTKIRRPSEIIFMLSVVRDPRNHPSSFKIPDEKPTPHEIYNIEASDFASSICSKKVKIKGNCLFLVVHEAPVSSKRLTQLKEARSLYRIVEYLSKNDNYRNLGDLEKLLNLHSLPSPEYSYLLAVLAKPRSRLRDLLTMTFFVGKVREMLIESDCKNRQDFTRKKAVSDVNAGNCLRESLVLMVNAILNLEDGFANEQKHFFKRLKSELILSKSMLMEPARALLDPDDLSEFLKNDIFEEICLSPLKNLTLFFEGLVDILGFEFSSEVLNVIRKDKFCLYISPCLKKLQICDVFGPVVRQQSVVSLTDYVFIVLERILSSRVGQVEGFSHMKLSAYFLGKQDFLIPSGRNNDKEATKRTDKRSDSLKIGPGSPQEPINVEDIKDWILQLEPILCSIKSMKSEQAVLLDCYIVLIIFQIFDGSIGAAKSIYDKLVNQLNQQTLYNSQSLICIYTLGGILLEELSLSEAEQQYILALLVCNRCWGDPRGRGASGRPIQLFLAWRLSILCRLQDKTLDAEYVEQMFDGVLLGLAENDFNSFMGVYHDFENTFFNLGQNTDFGFSRPGTSREAQNTFRGASVGLKDTMNDESSDLEIPSEPNRQNKEKQKILKFLNLVNKLPSNLDPGKKEVSFQIDKAFSKHPFSHWMCHERLAKHMDPNTLIKESLYQNQPLRGWLLKHLPLFQQSDPRSPHTSRFWHPGDVKKFYVTTMQTTMGNPTSALSSLCSFSQNNHNNNNNRADFRDGNPQNNVHASSLSRFGLGSMGNIKKNYYKKKSNPGLSLANNEARDRAGRGSGGRQAILSRNLVQGVSQRYSSGHQGRHGGDGLDEFDDAHPRQSVAISNISSRNVPNQGNDGPNYNFDPYQMSGAQKDNNSTLAEGGLPRRRVIGSQAEGNVAYAFENDSSTLNSRQLIGRSYAWGMSNQGQLGSILQSSLPDKYYLKTKLKTYHPKIVGPLSNILISKVSCGYTHTLAVTYCQRVFSWGSNKSLQLGLGEGVDVEFVGVPCPVPGLEKVRDVGCGSEHSLALLHSGRLYTWGQGEGGLLGHGDTVSRGAPKLVERLAKVSFQKVACGGLHTLALSENGKVFAWGRAEGGQLGVPDSALDINLKENESYLMHPMQLAFEGGKKSFFQQFGLE